MKCIFYYTIMYLFASPLACLQGAELAVPIRELASLAIENPTLQKSILSRLSENSLKVLHGEIYNNTAQMVQRAVQFFAQDNVANMAAIGFSDPVAYAKYLSFLDDEIFRQTVVKELANQVKPTTILESIRSTPFLSIAAMGILMAGLGFATSRIEEQDQKALAEYTQKQQDLTRMFDEFQKTISQNQSKAITALAKAFTEQKEKISSQFNSATLGLQEQIAHVQRAVASAQPVQKLVVSPIEWDRFFETSRMYSPGSIVWRNPFNLWTADDWQFDAQNTCFYQNSLTSMPKDFFWRIDTKQQNLFVQDPSLHQIFTEYVTDKASYEIEIECTLINVTYPFFVGIACNRGRWISGDLERLWWCRLIGLYGTSSKKSATSPEERSIALRCAQMRVNFDNQTKSRSLITPMQQIIDNNALLNQPVDSDSLLTEYLVHDPITFTFKIENSPSRMMVDVRAMAGERAQEIYKGPVANLDEYIYRFHGIGFIAVGCQAKFVIKKPQELVFSPHAVAGFIAQSNVSSADRVQKEVQT